MLTLCYYSSIGPGRLYDWFVPLHRWRLHVHCIGQLTDRSTHMSVLQHSRSLHRARRPDFRDDHHDNRKLALSERSPCSADFECLLSPRTSDAVSTPRTWVSLGRNGRADVVLFGEWRKRGYLPALSVASRTRRLVHTACSVRLCVTSHAQVRRSQYRLS